MRPRRHQKKAVTNVLEAFNKGDRAQLVMACGTGKTLIGALVLEQLKARSIIVLVPSLTLLEQTRSSYRSSIRGSWLALAVCSAKTLREHSDVKLMCDVTTKEEDITKFLGRKGRKIVFSTYQSAATLIGQSFDFGVFDEAHKTAGQVDKYFGLGLKDDNIDIKKRLFMTATPRRTSIERGKKAVSMGDATVYGEVAHLMSFRKAVKSGIICDYKVLITVVNKEVDTEKNSAAQIALSAAVRKYKVRSMFSYHHTVRDAKTFLHNMELVIPGCELLHVNGTQTWKLRAGIMEKFHDAKLALLTNSRCLIEGVDVPSVDLIAFTKPKRSVVDIVQATGRSMRKDPQNPNKKYGYVLVPVYMEKGESLDDALDRTDFSTVYEVLSAMRDQDSALSAIIDSGAIEKGEPEPLPNVEFENLTSYDITKLRKAITVKLVTGLMPPIELKKKKLIALARSKADKPTFRDPDPEISMLGNFLRRYVLSPRTTTFDQELRTTIERLAPDWFTHTTHKKLLMEDAKAGKPKPSWKDDHKRAEMLYLHTAPGTKVYDPEFVKFLQKVNPDWLVKNGDASRGKKRNILKHARSGGAKPSASKLVSKKAQAMYAAFSRYVGHGRDSYDRNFHMELLAIVPGWFADRDTFSKDRAAALKWAKKNGVKAKPV